MKHSFIEIIECAPVMSTDKLEKPKPKPVPTQPTNQIQAPGNTSTLPRNFSRIAIHQKGGLKRNASMSDVSRVEHNSSRSDSSHYSFHGSNNGILHRPVQQSQASQPPFRPSQPERPAGSINPSRQYHESSAAPGPQHLQVPPHIVKSIVISVLDKQGVPNPSDEIINRAIQEYYAKNPHGVSLRKVVF